jgi:prepilin-type N-terminal cleavage/methylation domain-containing protein
MPLSLQKKNAFTLIEILIVATILAILVATVIVAQKATIIKSKNTRIISAISEVRKTAERIYMKEITGYSSFCNDVKQTLNTSNEELRILERDIQESGGITYCFATQNSYCLGAKLFDGQFFCIDDEAHFGQTTTQKCVDGNTICIP